MAAHKLLAAGGVVALVAAFLTVVVLRAAGGGDSVTMTQLGPYHGEAHLESGQLGLQVSPALARGRPSELLFFNNLADVRQFTGTPADTHKVFGSGPNGTLEFNTEGQQAETGGFLPYTFLPLPENYGSYTYFGIAESDAATETATRRLVLYARVDALG